MEQGLKQEHHQCGFLFLQHGLCKKGNKMIETITLGNISLAITFIVSLIGGIGYLKKNLKHWIAKALEEQLQAIDGEIKGLTSRLDKVGMESCKNFIVRCLADFDHGDQISETELERFWEQYDYYSKAGGNSYITQKVKKLEAEGKI